MSEPLIIKENVTSFLGGLSKDAKPLAERIMNEAGFLMLLMAQKHSPVRRFYWRPVNEPQGLLQSLWEVRRGESEAGSISREVSIWDARRSAVAYYLNIGTRGSSTPVPPKTGKYYHFYWESKGEWRYLSTRRIPAIPGMHFLEAAIQEYWDRVPKYIRELFSESIRMASREAG